LKWAAPSAASAAPASETPYCPVSANDKMKENAEEKM
jgi:hypothetical protein